MNPSLVDAAGITAAGAVFAAFIAALAALAAATFSFVSAWLTNRTARKNYALQAKIAQQLKHADFRQAWIDELRKAMVEFQRLSVEAEANADGKNPGSVAFGHALEILLRMNPRDPNYDALLEKVGEVIKLPVVESRETWLDSHADFVRLCQIILKTEWDVLKRDLNDLTYVTPSVGSSLGKAHRRGRLSRIYRTPRR